MMCVFDSCHTLYAPLENNHKRYRIYNNVNIRDISRPVAGGIEINVTVSPNSDRQEAGLNVWRKRLTVRVRSPPLDGKANAEVEEYIKKITGCRSEIVKGHTARQKTVMIFGNADDVIRRLEASL